MVDVGLIHCAQRRDVFLVGCALLLLVSLVFFIRFFLAFTFPIPWSDEIDFIAPAFEFSRTGSFFVEGLNPDRVVMWMPPGYMLLLAAVFRLFGYSFDVARWVSALLFIAAYIVSLSVVMRYLRRGWLLLALLASLVAFGSPYALSIANMARMESFYTLTLLVALGAAVAGRPWVGVALVLTTALIHFNAVYFLIPFIVWFGQGWLWEGRVSIDRYDALALGAAIAALLIYLAYVGANWQGFLQDMRFQFAFKSLGQAFFGVRGIAILLFAYAMWIMQWLLLGRFSKAMFVGGFGAAFVFMYIYGKSMWYTYAECIGFYLLLVGGLIALLEMTGWRRQLLQSICLAVTFIALVYFSFFRITPEFQPLWPRSQLYARQFISLAEIVKVSEFVKSKPGAVFNFGHTGVEAFFLEDLAKNGGRWRYTVHSVTQPMPFRRSDYYIVCDSALIPQYLRMFELSPFVRKSQDSGCKILADSHQ